MAGGNLDSRSCLCLIVHWGAMDERLQRAIFENSAQTIGMGFPLLPWEHGVFAEIFGSLRSQSVDPVLSAGP